MSAALALVRRAPGSHTCAAGGHSVLVSGVRFDVLDRAAFLRMLDGLLACGQSHVIHFLAAHPTVEARSDERYRRILNEGTINLPDGLPVVWAGRAMGVTLLRLTGTDAMQLVCRWGLERHLAHAFYGGGPTRC